MSAAALLGLASFASGIESANVVGYTTTNCVKGQWYTIGVQFTTTTNTSMSIQDFLKGSFIAQSDASTAPSILIWNGSGYASYFYLSEAYSSDYGTTYANVWAGDDQVILNRTVKPGECIWFKDPNEACALTTAGQVLNVAQNDSSLTANQWNLVSNPYPESMDLNSSKITWTGLTSSSDASTAPTLLIWTGSGYKTYFYLTEAYSADYGTTYSNVWAGDDQVIADTIVNAGQGFFIKPTTSVTVTFTK